MYENKRVATETNEELLLVFVGVGSWELGLYTGNQ